MLKPEQIPDEVVEALLDTSNVTQPWKHAIAAAIKAWPNAVFATEANTAPCIYLPLPQEKTND